MYQNKLLISSIYLLRLFFHGLIFISESNSTKSSEPKYSEAMFFNSYIDIGFFRIIAIENLYFCEIINSGIKFNAAKGFSVCVNPDLMSNFRLCQAGTYGLFPDGGRKPMVVNDKTE